MKLFVRLMIFVVVLALAGPFFIKGPDGHPLWTMTSVKHSVVTGWDRLQRSLFDKTDLPGVSTDVTVYRWQDENGQWHYTQEPPQNMASDVLLIDPETNLISLPALPAPVVAEDRPSAATEPVTAPSGPLPNIEQTQKLIEDAQALQGVVDKRDQKLRDLR